MNNQDLNKALGLKNQRGNAYIKPMPKPSMSNNCALATTLKVIGLLNIVGGLIVGINLCGEDCLFGDRYEANGWGIFFFIVAGIIGCIICFALAKCVKAATKYLNSSK